MIWDCSLFSSHCFGYLYGRQVCQVTIQKCISCQLSLPRASPMIGFMQSIAQIDKMAEAYYHTSLYCSYSIIFRVKCSHPKKTEVLFRRESEKRLANSQRVKHNDQRARYLKSVIVVNETILAAGSSTTCSYTSCRAKNIRINEA